MTLSRIQFRRFFSLLDPLTAYANEQLDVVNPAELVSGATGLDEQAQAKVLYELWQNLNIVDRFIEENPAGMSFGELETIHTWRASRLTGSFCVWRFPDDRLRFMNDIYAFEVRGLSKEIEGMLSAVPAIVHTTLLPFDGVIVYSEYMIERPVVIGKGMQDMLEETAEKIVSEGALVATADAFVQASRQIHEEELARDLEALSADLDDSGAADQPAAGQHRGALAGLSFDERERAIDEYLDASREKHGNSVENSLTSILEKSCSPGPIRTSLPDLLADIPELDESVLEEAIAGIDLEEMLVKFEEGEKRDYAREFLSRNLEEMKASLSHEGMAQYLTKPENLEPLIGRLPIGQIDALRALATANGRMSVKADGLKTLAGLPLPHRGLCYVFREADTFEFIMPDEVVPIAQVLDWDALDLHAHKHYDLVCFFDALVELRGIATYDEAMSDYLAAMPDGFADLRQANDELMGAIESEEASLYLLDDGDEVYFLHYELAETYFARNNIIAPEDSAMVEGSLDDMLSNLLRAHEGHAPRIPTPEMLAEYSLFFWKEKQPPARAMCAYLDEHVPDDADDYFFADNVMEDLLDEAMWTGSTNPTESVKVFFDILDKHGFVPDESQIQPLLNLWMNLCNGLPIWSNNGWSPVESASADPNTPIFFNEDGSVKKVGRNDPCPCGSGKKYKKCHGR